jgi:sterol desaturase/sphingolipid hydroxylase (fatty acid hydroxylase superfamily)
LEGRGRAAAPFSMTVEITFGSLLLVALWEHCRQRRRREFPALRRRLGNLGIWLFNVIVAALIFQPAHRFRFWPESPLGFAAGFLVLDLLTYGIHRAKHAVPLFWRFHALHHSDPDVDVTTSVRHHPIEFLGTTGCFWLAVAGLGVPITISATYGLADFAVAAAVHGNVRWPAWLERLLRPVVITLDLHLVHHSIVTGEANANFGAVLSVWDRLFGTLAQPRSAAPVFGVDELSRTDACRPLPMLLTPWRVPR